MLRLRTLGNPLVERSNGPLCGAAAQRKCLALLALLAAAAERGVSRDKILAYLWPDGEPDKAAHRLAQLLYALRRDLQADALFLGSSHLRLNPQVISSDVVEFMGALDQGELERAVAVYGGPFMDGFYLSEALEFERWVEDERADYAKRFGAALESLASETARRGDLSGAAEWWRRLAQSDPLNSRVAERLMEALSTAGDRAGALHVAQVHETLLREELDAAPDPAVAALAEQIRHGPADLAQPSTLTAVPSGVGPVAPLLSIAVLPFVNLSPDPENEYFSDGMTEELSNALTKVEGLRVASRTSAFAFKGKNVDAREIGERLNVSHLVEGSVRRAGNEIRITAQLVSVADGYHLWSETYDRTLADVFALQDELSRAIVGALPLKPAGKVSTPLVRPSTDVLEAYTLYLRGRYFWNKRTVEGFRVGVECFERAIERDPGYAHAYAGLADCYAMLGFDEYGGMPALEAMPKAKAAALKALEIDPMLAEAHSSLAVIAMIYDWEWTVAEREFERALSLKPDCFPAVYWYALFLSAMGRHDESIRVITRAQELEPLSLVVHVTVGRCYFMASRYDEAIEHLRAALEMEPEHLQTYVWIARAYCKKVRFQEALAELEKGMSLLGRCPILLATSGYVYGVAGQPGEALEVLDELRQAAQRRYVAPQWEFVILMALDERDQAFKQLDLAYEQRSGYLAFLRASPLWDSLRSDPRYSALLQRMGFDK